MIVLPSRGRPASLAAFFATSRPHARGVVLLDTDNAAEYAAVPVPDPWTVLVGPRAGYGALLNRAFAAFPDEPWYAALGDDCRARPEGWDAHLATSAAAGAVAYGDDLLNGASRCCFPFLGGDLVRQVGWLAYPPLGHLYTDTVWRELGRALGVLRYCPEIVTEHLHWSVGKQPYDQTARERPCAGDAASFAHFMSVEFPEVVVRCQR